MVGKRLKLISHALLVQVKLFFSTSALVNNLIGSRATVGHSSSLLSQHKSHRNCLRFSLFLSAFSNSLFQHSQLSSIKLHTVFFKTIRSIPSCICIFQDFAFLFFQFLWGYFSSYLCPLLPLELFSVFSTNQPFYFSSTLVSRDLISSQFIFFS